MANRPSARASAIPKIGCVQHDCAECRRRESARMAEAAIRGDGFLDGLRESYPTHDEALEELRERIDEVLELRKELEREKEKRAPKALKARISELERDLATVNARLTSAQTLMPGDTSK